jgi:chaperonin cofactor prefoldin
MVGKLKKGLFRLYRSLVIETLRDANKTEPDRKCFRLVGGVLVERTVHDVLPSLEMQFEQVRLSEASKAEGLLANG